MTETTSQRTSAYLCDIAAQKIIVPELLERERDDRDELIRLGRNIREVGFIHPLSVRRSGGDYILVSGSRRLAAAKLVGIQYVPCLVTEADSDEVLLLSLSENMQRKNPNYFEQATTMVALLRTSGMSQGELASRLGQTQATVSNKIRLLLLPANVQDALLRYRFRERQARVLLRLQDEDTMLRAVEHAYKEKMNVNRFEEYVESLVRMRQSPPSKKKEKGICRDLRIYANTLSHTVKMMKNSGINTVFEKSEDEACIVYRIIVNKS